MYEEAPGFRCGPCVIGCISTQETRVQYALNDVARNICQALGGGNGRHMEAGAGGAGDQSRASGGRALHPILLIKYAPTLFPLHGVPSSV